MKRLEYFFTLKIIHLVIIFIPICKTFAQFPKDTLLANKYLKKAELLFEQKKLELSVEYYKKALNVESKIYGQNHEKIIIHYHRIGLIYRNLGEHEIALDYFETFVRLSIKKYGWRHFYTGTGFLYIGVTYKSLLQYDLALENYEKSLLISQYSQKKDMVAFTYENIGDVYIKNGEHKKAIEYYNKSIDIGTKLFGENYTENGISYQKIGNLYKDQKKYDKSLTNYLESLRIHIHAYGENKIKLAQLYIDIGDIYGYKKEHDISLSYYQKSLKSYMTVLDMNDPKVVNLNLRIANIYIQKNEYDNALQYYQKGLAIFQNNYDNKHITSDFYLNIAKVYNKKKEFTKAISYYDKAVNANRKSKFSDNQQITFDPTEYYDLKLLLTALQGKAITLQLKYEEFEKIEDLCASIEIYEQADILINYIRKSYQDYQEKLLFAENARVVYANAIKALFKYYKEIEAAQILEKIIYYIEKSKANTLKDLINESKTKKFAGLSSKLLELEKNQRANRAFYQSRIIDETSKSTINKSKIQEYENKLYRLSQTEDSLAIVLKKNYPKYHKLKHQNSLILVDDIQNMLSLQTTLLEFFISNDIVYISIINKNKISIKELYIPNLKEKISQFRRTIEDRNTNTYKKIARALYKDIILPIENEISGNELIIVPDGELWYLNFDLLLSKDDITNNPKELSYVLKKYAISYANSANLLFSSQKKSIFNFKQYQGECLAFSFSSESNEQSLNTISLANLTGYEKDLPGTRKEIKAIANIINGNYFYGSNAVETNFKKNVSKYDFLHLALHGKVDNEHPENSKLFFTQNKDTTEDNLLYSHELFALEIPAELTVLSACNTGTGKIAKGEGIMSLGTAFQYAGAKSLLLSSWEVSDLTAPDLMTNFYLNLKTGMTKSKALQQAKLQYLNNADINRIHPFYWGNFYLLGDINPVQFGNYYWYWIVIGIVTITLLLIFLLWYRKKNILKQ
ncbi:CHAT domain-containing protein [Aquimarina litoralis]|uniref:CHAT domain-containing protein n=1 Tax=Aquimarina litoralis TaxID=584605 RepID=UPI001C581885|nr:CHAT domain-containing tetratricopeptide repeat protein [Aquimarina litoralis]MBW1295302.1 CHAT domain-containing protein [Aquimarina litoralis]